jgi:beta-phosphoglucomutase-like phosphatase (HAD superfamily)
VPSPAADTRPPAEHRQVLLDSVAGRWWTALHAADSALRAAAPSLGGDELAARSRRLGEERSETVSLLRSVAHELQVDSRLLDWLDAPGVTRRLLGLPAHVVACVFYLDGVLTTSAAVHAAAWRDTLDPFLLELADRSRRAYIPFDASEYDEHLSGRPRLDGLRAFLAARGIALPQGSPEDPPGAPTMYGLANRKRGVLLRRLEREGVAAFAGSRCYLEAAGWLGVKRAVLSASANTARILERAGLAHLVDERIDGETLREGRLRPEPSPDVVLAACERLRVEPGHTAVFATTPAGVASARAAGAAVVVRVSRGGDAPAPAWAAADVVVDDLAALIDLDLARRGVAERKERT